MHHDKVQENGIFSMGDVGQFFEVIYTVSVRSVAGAAGALAQAAAGVRLLKELRGRHLMWD